MQRSQLPGSVILVALLMLVLGGISPGLAQQVQIDTQQGKVGETVTFTISLDRAPKTIDALGLTLTYDPTVLRYTGTFTKGLLVQEFDFFDAHERQHGQIRVGGFTTKKAIAAESGGKLVSLAFTVLSAGNTTVRIAHMVDDLAGMQTLPGAFIGQAALQQGAPPTSTPANQPEPASDVPLPTAPTAPQSTPHRQGLRLIPQQSPNQPVTARTTAFPVPRTRPRRSKAWWRAASISSLWMCAALRHFSALTSGGRYQCRWPNWLSDMPNYRVIRPLSPTVPEPVNMKVPGRRRH